MSETSENPVHENSQNQNSRDQNSRNGAAAEEPRWERVHPLSPIARFWFSIAIFLFIMGRQYVEDLFEPSNGTGDLLGSLADFFSSLSWWAWLILVAIVVFGLGGMMWSWWFSQYRVDRDSVTMRRGYFFRTEKSARLDRVQSIEITHPFVARLFGLAELRFDVADAGDSALSLEYLRKRDAENLRSRLLGRRQEILNEEGSTSGGRRTSAAQPAAETVQESTAAAPSETAPADAQAAASPSGTAPSRTAPSGTAPADEPSRVLARVGPGRAVAAALLGGTGIWLVFLLLVVVVLTIFFPAVGAASYIPATIATAGAVWSTVNKSANFRVALIPEGFQVRSGLTTTRKQTLPLGRIQAVGIIQPLLWRIPGWFRVEINSAGLGSSSEDVDGKMLLAVGTGQDLMTLLPHLVESAEHGGVDGYQLRAALEGSGASEGFTVAPKRARWVDPLSYRRNGWASTDDLLLLRSGRLRRRLSVVPHERTQSLAIVRGPLDQRLGLASVRLDSVGGSVPTHVEHLDVEDALRLAREQAARAAFARRLERSPSRRAEA